MIQVPPRWDGQGQRIQHLPQQQMGVLVRNVDYPVAAGKNGDPRSGTAVHTSPEPRAASREEKCRDRVEVKMEKMPQATWNPVNPPGFDVGSSLGGQMKREKRCIKSSPDAFTAAAAMKSGTVPARTPAIPPVSPQRGRVGGIEKAPERPCQDRELDLSRKSRDPTSSEVRPSRKTAVASQTGRGGVGNRRFPTSELVQLESFVRGQSKGNEPTCEVQVQYPIGANKVVTSILPSSLVATASNTKMHKVKKESNSRGVQTHDTKRNASMTSQAASTVTSPPEHLLTNALPISGTCRDNLVSERSVHGSGGTLNPPKSASVPPPFSSVPADLSVGKATNSSAKAYAVTSITNQPLVLASANNTSGMRSVISSPTKWAFVAGDKPMRQLTVEVQRVNVVAREDGSTIVGMQNSKVGVGGDLTTRRDGSITPRRNREVPSASSTSRQQKRPPTIISTKCGLDNLSKKSRKDSSGSSKRESPSHSGSSRSSKTAEPEGKESRTSGDDSARKLSPSSKKILPVALPKKEGLMGNGCWEWDGIPETKNVYSQV